MLCGYNSFMYETLTLEEYLRVVSILQSVTPKHGTGEDKAYRLSLHLPVPVETNLDECFILLAPQFAKRMKKLRPRGYTIYYIEYTRQYPRGRPFIDVNVDILVNHRGEIVLPNNNTIVPIVIKSDKK